MPTSRRWSTRRCSTAVRSSPTTPPSSSPSKTWTVRSSAAPLSTLELGGQVHLTGLVTDGGVHSHIDHLKALLRFAPEKTWIHAFTDGRDVSPHAAVHDLAELPTDRIATVAGRYYAMDRDQHWDRTERALHAIVEGEGKRADDP